MFENIKSGKFDFPSPYWDNISNLAKDMIVKILVTNPDDRPSAEEILEHPWLHSKPNVDLPEVPQKIREFNARRRLRRAATAIMAINKLKKAIMFSKESHL